jgi:hypothetical protein
MAEWKAVTLPPEICTTIHHFALQSFGDDNLHLVCEFIH